MMLSISTKAQKTKNTILATTPCVGFELQYSPLSRGCIENFADVICMTKISFRFDVTRPLETGRNIIVLFSNQHNPTQYLTMQIDTCNQIEKHYRVTISPGKETIMAYHDAIEMIHLPILKNRGTPVQISAICPACRCASEFDYVGMQDGDWPKGIMPLYTCASCSTTRTLIGLLGL